MGFWLLSGGLLAQNTINRIEYFIDTDPGFGNGTTVSFTENTTVTDLEFSVPMSAIGTGIHTLFVRARSSNNRWSTVAQRSFYKDAVVPSTVVNLVRLEYFIDTDPGFGSGSEISFTQAPAINNLEFTIPLNNIAAGIHTLSFRAKDANGRWSTVAKRSFYKDAIPTGFIENIVYIECFIDSDPGYNNGTSVSFTPSTQLIDLTASLNLNGFTNGAHKLYVRARNAAGRWSSLATRDFVIQENVVTIGSIPSLWCRQTAFSIPFTATGSYNIGNVFTAQLSDANGSFTNPTFLGSVSSTSSGTIQATIPSSVALGQNYQVRVISSNPSITNQPMKPIQVSATCPSPCPSSVTLTNPTHNYSSGVQLQQANSVSGRITATNRITGTAKVTYQANSVVLNPGFQASNGTVFTVERGGCN